MMGFAIGVTPSVTLAALGVSRLPHLARSRLTKPAIGGTLILVGLATLIWPIGGLMALCFPK